MLEWFFNFFDISARSFTGLDWRDFLDIFLLSLFFYQIILFIKDTRSLQVTFGLFILFLFYILANLLQLNGLYRFLRLILGSLVVILVVLYQSDIRKVLANLGKQKSPLRKSKLKDPYFFDRLQRAVEYFSAGKIGVLIAIERQHSLEEYTQSGTILDARLSAPFLISIFNKESPLHDGAVLIDRNFRIRAAACILPLTAKINLTTKVGTRHRAAIGLSEECDALILVLSEETGRISIFSDGKQEILHTRNFKQRIIDNLFEDRNVQTLKKGKKDENKA